VLPGSDPFGAMAQRYPEGLVPQGISAELIAAKWGFSRQQLDEFSAGSHEKAAAATKEGRFDNELAPIAGLTTDEIIRPGTTVETLAGLKPAFYDPAYEARFPQIKWEITPGNSSPLSDGSAAVLITTSDVAKRLGLRPLARIHTMTVVGSDPLYMLTGVIPATEKVLQRAGLTLADIDLFEVNEAFAPVVLSWAHDVGADLAKTNVNGGALAIGHPLGASAAPATGCRRCVRPAVWPTRPSSSGCSDFGALATAASGCPDGDTRCDTAISPTLSRSRNTTPPTAG
jgi:acetyl-CoA acyltransferase